MTWYPQEYLAKVPMTNMGMRANPSGGYPGRTYRFYKGPVVFPFGHGLSYTKFSHKLAQGLKEVSLLLTSLRGLTNSTDVLARYTNCGTQSLALHVDVKNTGTVDGAHTLLVFSTPPSGKSSRKSSTIKQLVDFKKLHLAAGSEQRVEIGIHVCRHLSVVDEFGIRRIPTGEHKLQIGDIQHSISVQTNLEEIKT
jgi:hypothetical protein